MDEFAQHATGHPSAAATTTENGDQGSLRRPSIDSALSGKTSIDERRSFEKGSDSRSSFSDDDATIVSRDDEVCTDSTPNRDNFDSPKSTGESESERTASNVSDVESKEDPTSRCDDLEGQQVSRDPPDGGTKAWLIAVGACSALVCSFGYLNTFGVFQSYFQRHLLSDKYPSQIAWIGSTQVFLLFLGGLASGPLTDRYGFRAVFIPAALLLVSAVMLSSICTTYATLLVTHGIMFGTAAGMIFTPAVAVVGQYFTAKRATATGVAVSGASIGGIAFPLILDRLLNSTDFGFGPSVRVLGGVMAVLLTFTAVTTTEFAPRRKRRFFLWQAFSNTAYIWSLAGFCLTLLGFWAPIFFIVEYAESQGVDAISAFYLVAIMNTTSFAGRIFLAVVADMVGCYNANAVMTACTAVLIFTWTVATTQNAITAWIACYGFFQGGTMSLISPCIAQISPRATDIGTYVGMALACGSLGGLVDTPINGALISRFGYRSASIFSGMLVLSGAICLAVARFYLRPQIRAKI